MNGETIAMIKALQVKSIENLKTSGGTADAGKVLTVGNDGKITPTNLPVGEGQIALDGSLSVSGAAADAKVVGDAISAVNGSLDEYVLSRIGDYISPNIIDGDESMTAVYVSKDGVVHSSTTMKCSDYLPVHAGDVLSGYTTTANGVFGFRGFRFVCAYDDSKNAIPEHGTNTTIGTYTVPDGVSFVRVTWDGTKTSYNFMVSVNCTPTKYVEYTDPQRVVTDNFLTPESESFLSNLMTNGVSTTDLGYKHGCAYPHGVPLVQTVGLPETWYFKSALTPYTTYQFATAGASYTEMHNDKVVFKNNVAVNATNGFNWYVFDMFMNPLDREIGENGVGRPRRIIDENLSDCTLLAIGDSTVDHDTMTATLLSHFTEQGHTITLLGTLGEGNETNHNEGRAGWKASDYFTDRQYQGVVNPFYNPTTQTFDFGYYMNNQGYTSVDFVVIQLGINDLYNYASTANIIPTTWDYIKRMVQSVLAYDSNIKIILNLPTTPNSDQTAHSNISFLYQNTVIRYNEYAQAHALSEFGRNTVRTSYCHLILDPDTEIRDNVHPTIGGYQKMALELVNQINCWQNGY